MRARNDLPSVPRSLFDCPQTIGQRIERDGRLVKPNFFKPGRSQLQTVAGMNRATLEPVQDHPEWLIHEDWALLQVSLVTVSLQNFAVISQTVLFLQCFDTVGWVI